MTAQGMPTALRVALPWVRTVRRTTCTASHRPSRTFAGESKGRICMLATMALLASCTVGSRGTSSVDPSGHATLVGTVRDSATGQPVPGASLELVAQGRSASLASGSGNDSGLFAFDSLPAGNVELRVRRIGYESASYPVRLRAGRRDSVDVRLASANLRGAICVMMVMPSIEVEVTDAEGGALGDSVSGEVLGEGKRAALVVERRDDRTVILSGARHWDGFYTVIVRSPGYREWRADSVRVEDRNCFPMPPTRYARLEPIGDRLP